MTRLKMLILVTSISLSISMFRCAGLDERMSGKIFFLRRVPDENEYNIYTEKSATAFFLNQIKIPYFVSQITFCMPFDTGFI